MAIATVGELEAALFEAFPAQDAEGWDQPGLSVGDRSKQVGKVAFNLDQSTEAVIVAAQAGCNVLVTHHPPFIKGGPTELGPATDCTPTGPGRMLFEAARRDINVIAMHTNADRAVAVREHFAELLSCDCEGNFEHLQDPARSAQGTGFGAVLTPAWDGPATLGTFAGVCLRALGGAPRVWGSAERPVHRIAYLNGSWSEPELYGVCTAAGIDCMVVGESRYHVALDAQPHLAIVELGHDRSEIPIVDVLRGTVAAMGFPDDSLVMLDCAQGNWWTPDPEV